VALLTTSLRGQIIVNTQINTNGFYYNLHEHPPYDSSKSYLEFIFFYNDGTMYWFIEQTKINEVDFKIKDVLKNIKKYKYIGEWGYYSIKGDTLDANLFIHDGSRIGKIREQWKMFIGDSLSIYLTKTICDRCKNQYSTYGNSNEIIFQPNIRYKFESSLIRPDSSQMRLRKKEWFRKEMKQRNESSS
jgi:hypothetical protein